MMRHLLCNALAGAALTLFAASGAYAQDPLFVRHIQISAEQVAAQAPPPADPYAFERELAAAIMESGNAERARAGLSQLTMDAALSDSAARYSRLMRDQNFFAHVSPSGETLSQRLPQAERRRFAKLGENLWSGEGALDWRSDVIARQAAEDWILSPSHRDNLLESAYSLAGVGAAVGQDKVYVTMLYARPHDDPAFAQQVIDYPNPPADLYSFSRSTEMAMLAAINAERARRGVASLNNDFTLGLNAQEHARHIMSVGDVNAGSTEGQAILRRVLNEQPTGIRSLSMALWQATGGIPWDGTALAGEALDSWNGLATTMNDLTDPRYDNAGVGFVTDGQRVFVSVLLSEPALATASAAPLVVPSTTLLRPLQDGLQTRSGGQYITIE